jgi:hypothetical protein
MAAWLAVAGYGAPQRAAVLHHAQIESRMRSNAISPDGRHWGLFQWRDGRRLALFRLAAERHRAWTDPEVQLEHMNREARSLAGMQAFWRATTAREAIKTWCVHFERRKKC